jgi:hypothetical protein
VAGCDRRSECGINRPSIDRSLRLERSTTLHHSRSRRRLRRGFHSAPQSHGHPRPSDLSSIGLAERVIGSIRRDCRDRCRSEHGCKICGEKRSPSQVCKTVPRNHADNGRFSPCVMNSLASISVVSWLPTGFADGGGNARMILRALDQLAISWPSGPKSLIKSEHGRPVSPINCSDIVSISN